VVVATGGVAVDLGIGAEGDGPSRAVTSGRWRPRAGRSRPGGRRPVVAPVGGPPWRPGRSPV